MKNNFFTGIFSLFNPSGFPAVLQLLAAIPAASTPPPHPTPFPSNSLLHKKRKEKAIHGNTKAIEMGTENKGNCSIFSIA